MLTPAPPQSKDLEQQLQEELLEVVSELQTVRTPPPGLPGHREASAPPHLPEPGSRWRTRRAQETPAFSGTKSTLSPALGPGRSG